MQSVTKKREAVTFASFQSKAMLVIVPQLDQTSMTTAEYMEPGVAYRFRGTPNAFYMRADLTAHELRARLTRKRAPSFPEKTLLIGLASVPCPILAYRVTRHTEGERRELCVLAASMPLRKLKALPFAN